MPATAETSDLPRPYYALESTGIAVGLLLASLHLAGLSTLTHTPKPMAFLNSCLDLDESYKPFMLVVTGHAAPSCFVPDIKRKALGEICQIR